MARKKIKRFAAIQPPALPGSAQMRHLSAVQLLDGAELSQISVSDADCTAQSGKDLFVERSIFRKVHFNQTRIQQSQWVDVQFDACDFLNADWEKIHLQRVEYINSRLAGIRLAGARIEHLTMQGCQLDYAS